MSTSLRPNPTAEVPALDAPRLAWLESIEPGAYVFLHRPYGMARKQIALVAKCFDNIINVAGSVVGSGDIGTSADDFHSILRDTGTAINNSLVYITPASDTDVEDWDIQEARISAYERIDKLLRKGWGGYDLDQYERIEAILKEENP